ncbi:MAG: PorT family protein [Spirochaetota bacterium]|nr:PorT family protein [Spirochaetota bacterium]
MKKNLLCANLLAIILLLVCSKSLYSYDFQLGLKGLVGATGLSLVEEGDYEMQLGYGLGVSLAYTIEDYFSVELDLFILQKGARTFQGNTISINYLSIPLLLKADPFNLGAFLSVGAQINLLIQGTLDDRFSNSITITDAIEPMSYDLILGIGYQKDILMLELRYEYGLSDILINQSYFGNVIEKNNTLYVLMGVMFTL